MAFNHVQETFNMEDCLRNDVQHLLHKSLRRSSTSESETDGSTEMTVLRPKLNGRASRLASERSHGESVCDSHWKESILFMVYFPSSTNLI